MRAVNSLTKVASLLPIDSMELVKAALEQQRFLYKHVATAVRQSMRDAQPVIISKITARKSIVCKSLLAFITRKNGAQAARRGARINEDDAAIDRQCRARLFSAQSYRRCRAITDERPNPE